LGYGHGLPPNIALRVLVLHLPLQAVFALHAARAAGAVLAHDLAAVVGAGHAVDCAALNVHQTARILRAVFRAVQAEYRARAGRARSAVFALTAACSTPAACPAGVSNAVALIKPDLCDKNHAARAACA